jgi:hypothetical protein
MESIKIVKKWIDLDWESLVRYHRIDRASLSEMMVKVKEFECISGLDVVGVAPLFDGGLKEYDAAVREVEDVIAGRCDAVYLVDNRQRKTDNGQRTTDNRRRKTDDGLARAADNGRRTTDNGLAHALGGGFGTTDGGRGVYYVGVEDFCAYVREVTDWMSHPEGLLRLPEKFVVVGGETFALPDVVGFSERVLSYGQYCDMQAYMTAFWSLLKKIEGDGELSSSVAEKFKRVRNSFVASLLLPTMVEEYSIDQANGEAKKGHRRVVLPYDRREQERIAAVIDADADWLCPILMQLVQSGLAYYHARFPGLVSGSGGGKAKDLYVAKLGTDNAVMKYAGYGSVGELNNEPFGTVLEWLHVMAMEHKEIEKMRRKK